MQRGVSLALNCAVPPALPLSAIAPARKRSVAIHTERARYCNDNGAFTSYRSNAMTPIPSRRPTASAPLSPLASAGFLLAVLLATGHAGAQQAGTAAQVSVTLPASAAPVQGWSVGRGLLGRPVYAAAGGKRIGTVLDLVVTSTAAPYVVVIGVAGLAEIGAHAVAVPLAALVEQQRSLILPGATRASLKAMPRVTYSNATVQRAEFIRAAAAQLTEANAQLRLLQQRAAAETGAVKAQLDADNAAFEADITRAEDQLADLEKAEAARWVLLRNDVHDALVRVRAAMSPKKAEPAAPAPAHP